MQSILSDPVWPKGSPSVVIPTLMIRPNDYLIMIAYAQASSPSEINGYCLVRQVSPGLFAVEPDSVFITDQTVSAASAKTTARGVAYANQVYQAADDGLELLQWHSHARIEAYHSATDLGTANDFSRGSMTSSRIWVVVNDRGHMVARIELYRPIRVGVPMRVVMVPNGFEDELAHIREEVSRHVLLEPPVYSKDARGEIDLERVVQEMLADEKPTDGSPCAGVVARVGGVG